MNSFSFSDIYLGLEESFEVELDIAKFTKFLDITDDINPLHVSEEYAVAKGFKGKVVYGLLTSSFYSTLVGVYLPGKNALLQGIDIQFSKPVYIGDRLRIYGQVSYINSAYQQIEVKATITNQDLVKISKAKIKIGVDNG